MLQYNSLNVQSWPKFQSEDSYTQARVPGGVGGRIPPKNFSIPWKNVLDIV